ncbi:MAG: hypothetical protein EWV55_15080 [Microcystis viridis Mv_BB_P_19951000_S69]|uniref:Uncharacterized protein n=1 Tax=Microcystis viridis Mv_BB_P_19951000_S68D TaxID=2486270 RepID=A0A552H9V3_MICVR|nr:MAG: hypothetical protein EWV77_21070 [Microcystis viridis Mv_BB_P_19951000_S68D]TRU68622.1 MAG: hypothetical protein EWV47_22300 [Microcystis viridis Mv_BB_P_19951000_S68]TRU72276.1 MAG: hypothetical protein EWV55_15080 [Microcystis viridis Mv_BB_P_19951000_S69]TRU83423.1 MAG: hypothetical protein EWV46_16575 [Microcystis viridis Mv_BB_P_19951000_S69D]
MRDSSATLIFICERSQQFSARTKLTYDLALQWHKSVLKVDIDRDNLFKLPREWSGSLGDFVLNVAGFRESECPGIYSATKKILPELLNQFYDQNLST